MPNLITEGGGGLETDKKWLRDIERPLSTLQIPEISSEACLMVS